MFITKILHIKDLLETCELTISGNSPRRIESMCITFLVTFVLGIFANRTFEDLLPNKTDATLFSDGIDIPKNKIFHI